MATRTRLVILAMLVVAAGLGAVSLLPGTITPAPPPTPDGFSLKGPDILQIVTAGITRPYTNGSPIPIAGTAMTALQVERLEDSRYGRWIELSLYQGDPTRPIDRATVSAEAQMRFMEHGSVRTSVPSIGAGKHAVGLMLDMPGDWDILFSIATPAGSGEARLYLTIAE